MSTNSCSSKSQAPPSIVRRSVTHCLIFTILWYILAGSDYNSWIIGVPAVLFAATVSLLLSPPYTFRISLTGAFWFIPFFLKQSFHGGIDVMRRALSPRQLLDPGLIPYTTLLPEGTARIFFINCISLLPGTLSANLDGNMVTIHTLDQGLPIWANIQELEHHVAALMCISQKKIKQS